MRVGRREFVQFLADGLDERNRGVFGRQVGVRADELGVQDDGPVERAGAQRPGHEHRRLGTGPRFARRQRPTRTGRRGRRELVVVSATAARIGRRLGPARRTATRRRRGRSVREKQKAQRSVTRQTTEIIEKFVVRRDLQNLQRQTI